VDRARAEGALVETPKAPIGVECGEGVSAPRRGRGLEGSYTPPQKFFLLFDLKMELSLSWI